MDVNTGRIVCAGEANLLNQFFNRPQFVEMKIPPTPKQMNRIIPRVGRNEPCPCGSGKKFKKCCLVKK